MWKTMGELNRDFGKAFIVCAVVVTTTSLALAYWCKEDKDVEAQVE